MTIDPREMTPADLTAQGFARTSRGEAIRAMCLQCVGTHNEIRLCECSNCPLYLFRMGTDPWREKVELSDERRAEMSERLRLARAAANGRQNATQGGVS